MPQIPEEVIQTLMRMTGQGRAEVERILQESVGRVAAEVRASVPGKASVPGRASAKGGAARKPTYTCERYPHYLPSERVLKYTLRITLRYLKPAIWRKVEVPSNISLRHLGDLILALMGWSGGHLNQFVKGNSCYMPYYQRESSGEADYEWGCENLNQEDYTIADLLSVKGRSVVFEYDFGDGWEHEVRLSAVGEYADGEPREIVFVGGKRECPPDDCGGVWGFESLLDILSKRKAGKRLSTEEREHLDWAGWDRDYDPEALDLDMCRAVAESFNQ